MHQLTPGAKITSKEQFFTSIEDCRIPVLAPGSLSLVSALAADNQTWRDLTLILERFPGIAAKLIALVNSAWSAPIDPITSLEAACSRLGVNVVKSVSTALAVSGSFDTSECQAFSPEHFWSGSLLVAESAAVLAPLLDGSARIDLPTARTAGLLHNLGLLFLVDLLPAQTSRVLRMSSDSELTLNALCKQELGIGITDIGGFLAHKWRLPAALADVMSNYDNGDYQGEHRSLVDVVSISVEIVAALSRDINVDLQEATRLGQLLDTQQAGAVGDSLTRAHQSITQVSSAMAW